MNLHAVDWLIVSGLLVLLLAGALYTARFTKSVSAFLGQRVPAGAGLPEALKAQAVRQHAELMHRLLVQSCVALAIMAVLATALGWLVAGRVLRPLRTMTNPAQSGGMCLISSSAVAAGSWSGRVVADCANAGDTARHKTTAAAVAASRRAVVICYPFRNSLAALRLYVPRHRSSTEG